MKNDLEITPSTAADLPLRVEVRTHEEDGAETRGQRGLPNVAASKPWLIHLIVLGTVLVTAGIYVAFHIGKGWVPADDGILSQSALRVMRGQLPHRDFGEVYTGGMSFVHALAFRAFGVNLMSLRICVFLFFLTWLPAVYYIAQRFISPLAAGLITLLAVAWSYPNYPAAMPSWYNLFFATFGAAALVRYLDVRTRRWLFVAGVCGGISLLVKVIGAYYVAGVLLFFAFLEQSESAEQEQAENSWPYRLFSASALLLFVGVLVNLLRARLAAAELYHFLLPSAAVVGLIFLGELSVRAGTAQRFKTIFRILIPFLCGVISPIIVFLIPYARAGAIPQFFSGVASSAVSRAVGLAVLRPVPLGEIIWTLPLIGILAAAMYWDQFQGKAVGAALGLGALVIAIRAAHSFEIIGRMWRSVAMLTPIAVLLGAVVVFVHQKARIKAKLSRQQAVLLISLAATCSLVQFPFPAAIYLSYTAPLTLLALVAIVSTGKTQQGTFALTSAVMLYLVFGVVSLVPLYTYEITSMVSTMYTMHEPRAGGLQIQEAVFFDRMAGFLREHSPNGLMFAGNDCPELYFLSGLTNVAHDDNGETPEAILKAIQRDDLNLVVVNDAPYFPGAIMRPDVKNEIAKRFPHTARFGIFHIFWKQ
jgi:hypothetical protein